MVIDRYMRRTTALLEFRARALGRAKRSTPGSGTTERRIEYSEGGWGGSKLKSREL